ncbi:MAG: Ig-like domain-containing protein [Spirochaetota bacterium]
MTANRGSTNRPVLAGLVLLFAATALFGAGRTEEEDFQQVEGTGNWEYTIDVSDWEPGKYNILVRARDEAGNVALGGPYNVFVDPESDRPDVSISYPVTGQAVGERLFVVGTARDDDAVGHVEVQIDDGSAVRADGAEYWSALLPMASLPDGPHTVRARAVDVNGVEGDPVETVFHLDTTKPVTTPTSHESGVLIGRRTTIEGTVEDANGIASLTLVAGDRRENLPLRGGDEEARQFSFQIDPQNLEEGATVWWLESTDRTGSQGVTPFLFYVDTSPPELQVLYPTEADRVDAQLRFVGRVFDLVGIESLTYQLSSGESDEIPLTPGDPYWSLATDLPPETRGNVTATFTVTDVAGNEHTERLRYELDTEGDQPVVTLAAPEADAVMGRPTIAGHVLDDDAPAAVLYTIDDGEEARLELTAETQNGFVIPLPSPAPGRHTISVRAVDIYDVEGPAASRVFTVATPLPSISITEVRRGEQSEAYAPGFALAPGEGADIAGRLRTSGGAPLPERLDYRIGSQSRSTAVNADGEFSVSLPRSSEGAPIPILLSVTNETGRTSQTSGFYVQLPSVQEDAPPAEVTDVLARGLYLTAGELAEPDDDPIEADAITLARGESIRLLAVGGRPTEPSISPQVDFLAVRTSGNHVIVEATGDGAVTDLRVSAQIGGRTASAPPFSIATEHRTPEIPLPEGVVGRRFADLGEISVAPTDSSGVESVRISVEPVLPPVEDETDAATETPVRGTLANRTETGFSAVPTLPREEGPAIVRITATDASGLTSRLDIPIMVDRSPPQPRVVTPPPDTRVNGTITMHLILSEPGTTTRAAILATPAPTADGDPEPDTDEEIESGDTTATETRAEPQAVELEPARLVAHEIVTSQVGGSVRIAVEDTAGNAGEHRVDITTDATADLPELQLQVPEEGGLVQQEFRVSGVLLDDDAPESITIQVDDLEPVTMETDGTFDVRVSLDRFEDGDHTVTVFGTDIGGVRSEPITRTFAISRTQPETVVTSPSIESYQRGTITIRGTASDPNGIREVFVSTDNGASYRRARGTEEWSFLMDTTLLADGTHSILVRAVDGAGVDSLLATTINVDNTAPLLELVEPFDGLSVSGTFLIDGRGEDGALRDIRLVAQAMEGDATAIELVTFDSEGPFAYVVDTSTLEPGWYNLRVEAEDRAGNARRISRNLRVEPADLNHAPEILTPGDGSEISHRFSVTVEADPQTAPLTLLANGAPIGVVQIGANGVGSFQVEPGTVATGPLELTVRTEPQANGEPLRSESHTISYETEGPWVSVAAPGFLSFVRDRPFVTGTAGYELELPEGDDGETQRARRELESAHRVERVEVSLDNGVTYEPARGREEWSYRLETTELTDGRQNLVIRARFANGESAVVRHSLVIDENPPEVRLLEPQERDTFDDSVRIVGVTTDENPLADVSVVLREGDKASYEIPSFIQGLYLDAHALGATYFDVGAGLSFFDNNVRLQTQVGVSPEGRFNGLVLGAKLLANVAALPASFFFGPDFEWLSGALALGANFSYFTMSEDRIEFTPEGLMLAGMIAQLEFPIMTVPDMPLFNTYAFYTEAQLWFISSDVEGGTVSRLSFGVRIDVF